MFHYNHTRDRIKERYDITLSKKEYDRCCALIKAKSEEVFFICNQPASKREVWEVCIDHEWVPVVWDGFDIITVLEGNMLYGKQQGIFFKYGKHKGTKRNWRKKSG